METSYTVQDERHARRWYVREVLEEARAAGLVDDVDFSTGSVRLKSGSVEVCLSEDEAVAILERALLLRLWQQRQPRGAACRGSLGG